MRRRSVPSRCALVLLSVVISMVRVGGQTSSTEARSKSSTHGTKPWTLPRTPDGQPDLSGIWTNSTLTPLERPREVAGKEFFTPEEVAEYEKRELERVNTDRRDGPPEVDVNRSYNEYWRERGKLLLRTSLIVDPPDGRIPPLTPEAQKREGARAEARRKRGPADSWEDRNLAERCLTRGAPKLPGGYNNNFQVWQTPQYVAILQEMIHEVRVIPLDGRQHLDKSVHLWMGDSRGRWQGDTLVVDTTNFNDNVMLNSFDCCGAAGANLRVVERFTRIDADTIDYSYTVDDPTTYTKTWTVAVPLKRAEGPLFEYACHEGNYAMPNILRGARTQEKAAAEGAAK